MTTIAAQVTIVGDPVMTAQPLANQEICQGNTINNALTFNYAGGTGNATIAWYLAATPPVLINGVTTNTYLPIPFNIADTFNYYATLLLMALAAMSSIHSWLKSLCILHLM